MIWHRYAPSLVLAACVLLSASLGGAAELWLGLLSLATLLQARALWRLYRNG